MDPSSGITHAWQTLAIVVVATVTASAQSPIFSNLHQMLPEKYDGVFCFATGDVDGDGDLDLLISSPGPPDRLYLNDGSGIFEDVSSTHLPSDSSYTIALGDVDGDGDLDVLKVSSVQRRLHLNDGTGVFTDATATHLPSGPQNTSALALGDVDGDGDLDALIGNWGGQNSLYLNDGSGVFADATGANLPVDSDSTYAVVLADVDGDGDQDAFVGNTPTSPTASDGQNRLYLNDGSGVFSDATATHLPPDADGARALVLRDVDGDGDLDAFVANRGYYMYQGGQNRLYLNDGSGVFADVTATNLPTESKESQSLALGDVDGDGDVDALIGDVRTPNRLYVNDGFGVFSDATSSMPQPDSVLTRAVALSDMDGDGDLDALIGGYLPFMTPCVPMPTSHLYLNPDTGIYSEWRALNLPVDSDNTWALALGDVDGDDDLDVLVGNEDQNRLYLNDGSGACIDAPSTSLAPCNDTTRAVALGDVDGDGDLDGLIGNAGSGEQNRLLLNDGLGAFTDVTSGHVPTDSDRTMALALGDVDGDGDLDVFLGNRGFSSWWSQNRLYLNDGAGVFADVTAARLPYDADETLSVALGDLDGDGDLDALLGNQGPNRLYLNQGSGFFGDVTPARLPGDNDATASLALGDVDGDGDLDALIGNDMVPTRLYLNDGSAFFSDVTATHLPLIMERTVSLAFGDVDADGDLDACLGGALICDSMGCGLGQNRLLLNDGSGIFSDAAPHGLPEIHDMTRAIALGDLDGDGDLDVLVGNASYGDPPTGGQNRLFFNLSRQLAWRGLPRFGKPLTLELHGPAGAPWILGASLGTAQIPSPSWGTLRLDPSSLIVLAQGTLDGQGRDTRTYEIAPDPGGAAGLTVYAQAAFGVSLWLGNRETLTFSNL